MPASSQHKIKIVVEGEDKASGALKSAGSALDGFGKGARDLGGKLTGALTLPLVGLGALAIKASTDLNAAMANVASLGVPTDRVLELKTAVQDMSIAVGKSTDDLAGGLYQVISAFGDTADTVKILEINAKAGAAGLATTLDAINLTSAVTKGYGDTSAEAVQKASDLAFVTVQLGQTTFPELAGAIGKVVPLANNLNVSQEELFATMATATGVTGNAAEVSTQLRGVLQSLMAPTGEMTSLMESAGYASGGAMVENIGLKGTIDAIIKAAKATGTPLAKYIGSIEGQTLALTLAGSQSDTYAEKLAAMGDATGATDAAFAAQTEGINAAGFAMAQARQKMEVFAQKMGDALGPALLAALEAAEPLLDGLLKMADGFTAVSPTTQRWVLALAGVAVAAGPVIWAVGAIAGAIGAVLPVIGAIGAALGLLLSPIVLVAAAVAGLGAVFYRFNIGGFRDGVDNLLVSIGNLAKGFQTFLSGTDFAAFQTSVTGAFGDIWAAVQGFFSGDISVDSLGGIITEQFGAIRTAITDLFSGTDFAQFLTEIKWDDFISKLTWENFVSVMSSWGTWITSLDWTKIITTAIDWATWIPALTWTAFITSIEWSAYLVKLAWDAIIGIVNWGEYILSLDWSGSVPSITWADFVAALDWVGYIASFTWSSFIGKLNWTGVLPKMGNWGTYITSLDWTAIVIQMLDWATWIPAMVWNNFVGILEWSVKWIPRLTWASFVTLLNWGKWVVALPWKDWIGEVLDWGKWVVALPWGDWIGAVLKWSAFVASVAWGDFVPKLKWPNLDLDWGAFIPDWPGWGFFNPFKSSEPATNSTGTNHWRGGLTWVGEKGAELVNLPRGAQVFNHERSMAMVGSASSGGDTYNITFAPAVNSQIDLEVAFDQLLRKMERRRP